MKPLFLLVLVVSFLATGQVAHSWFHLPRHHPHHQGQAPSPGHAPSHGHAYPDYFRYHKRIFVFGDSYADTGNSKISEESWKIPYGMTFPGHPSGRYSNGLVLTDFFARHFGGIGLGPIPFQQWRKVWRHPALYFGSLLSGMNFAHGGTGVYDTEVSAPNMTVQIDLFEQVVNKHFGSIGMENTIALVTNSGNDYTTYLARENGTINTDDVMNFIGNVTSQLGTNLRRIQALGVKKVAVANLQALQCIPRVTKSSSYKQCDGDTIASLVDYHNICLDDQVKDLNQETGDNTFITLNICEAFVDVIKGKDYQSRFPEMLKGCCMGTTNEGYCAVVDEHWKPMYTVCKDPERSFFWDMVHPTQAGWEAVYERLIPTLKLLE